MWHLLYNFQNRAGISEREGLLYRVSYPPWQFSFEECISGSFHSPVKRGTLFTSYRGFTHYKTKTPRVLLPKGFDPRDRPAIAKQAVSEVSNRLQFQKSRSFYRSPPQRSLDRRLAFILDRRRFGRIQVVDHDLLVIAHGCDGQICGPCR